MSQRSIASGSSRREFLKAGAAAVALPAAEPTPGLVLQAERETFSVVILPEFRLARHGLSRGEAESYSRAYNRPAPGSLDDRRAVLFCESGRVRLVGAPIEVEAEEPEDDPEEEPELVVTRSDVWIDGTEGREEALVCVEPERAERFAASFNTPGCRCHRAVVTSYQVVRPAADLAERIRA